MFVSYTLYIIALALVGAAMRLYRQRLVDTHLATVSSGKIIRMGARKQAGRFDRQLLNETLAELDAKEESYRLAQARMAFEERRETRRLEAIKAKQQEQDRFYAITNTHRFKDGGIEAIKAA